MTEAIRDQNHIPVMLGVSSVDSTTPLPLSIDPVTGRLLTDSNGAGGYTNLTQFVNQTAWKLFYSNGSGDVTELALGALGTYLYSNGAAVAPTWSTPAGGGDVVGPASAVDSAVALYDGVTGKLLKDSATTIATTPTVSTLVKRDASANIFVNNYFANTASTVSAGGTTVLTVASARTQNLTGSSAQTFQLPDATTLSLSSVFDFNNNSSASLTITNAGAVSQYVIPPGGAVLCFCTSIGSANGTWDFHAVAPASVTWGSGVTGLVMNSVLTTSPSVGSGASSSTAPSFIPQRGASTTGFGGDGTNLYATIAGTARLTIASTGITVPAINKVTITAPATGSTLTIADGKVLTVNNTITFAGTDSTTMTFPSTNASIARTDAAQTFTGVQTMTSPAITTSITTGSASFTAFAGATTLLTIGGTGASASLFAPSTLDTTSSTTGAIRTSGGISAAKAANFGTTVSVGTSLELGHATDTTFARVAAGIFTVEGEVMNGYATTATAAGTTALTIVSAKTQFFTGSTTQTVTLPTTSVIVGQAYRIVNNSTGIVTVQSSGANSIQILGAGMSAILTAIVATPTTAANWMCSLTSFTSQNIAQTAAANAATVNIAYVTNTISNNSAATLTITIPTAGAIDGEMRIVRVLDFSAVAQTITWVNTENSATTAPVTSNGSTTLPITAGFQYNSATSKWRCIASA